MATQEQVAEYRAALQSLTVLAQRDLRDVWSGLNPAANPVAVRDVLVDVYPDVVSAYGDTAAVLGADWFDMLRDAPPSATRFQAVVGDPASVEQAQASVRWAVGALFTSNPNPDDALKSLMGSTQRLVSQPFRDTVYDSARRDPSGVRFARVPVGVTCRFCTMVASRGFVYATAANAGEQNKWHDNCNCMIVPGRSNDDYPADLEVLRQAYRDGSGIGRDVPAE